MRHLLLSVLALSLGACAGPPLAEPAHDSQGPDISELERRLQGDPENLEILALYAHQAAFFDAEPASVLRLLERARSAVGALPADAALLACELAAAQRDYPAIEKLCGEVVVGHAATFHGELAAGQLLAMVDQTPTGDPRALALLEQGLARCQARSAPGSSCAGLALQTARARLTVAAQREDADAYQRALAGIGAVQRWRVCGPLAGDAVDHYRALHADDARLQQWDRRRCRARVTAETGVHPTAYSRRGVQLLETWVHVTGTREALVLMQLPVAARVRLDGVTLADLDPWLHPTPSRASASVQLSPGWHRLELLTLPRRPEAAVAVWFVDSRGGPAIDAVNLNLPDDAAPGRCAVLPSLATAATLLEQQLDPVARPWQAWRLVALWTDDHFADGERARQLAAQLVELYPEVGTAWFALAEGARTDPTLPAAEQQSLARRALASTLTYQPEHLIARYRLALMDFDERPEEALEAMRALVEAYPDYPWGLRRLHAMLAARGRRVEAASLLERAQKLAPGEASLEFAEPFWREVGALQLARAALQARIPLETRLHSTRRAQWRVHEGDLEGALAAYDAAFALAPDASGHDQVYRLARQVEGWAGVWRRSAQRLQAFPNDLNSARWRLRAARGLDDPRQLAQALAEAEQVRPGLPEWQRVRLRAGAVDPGVLLPVEASTAIAAFEAAQREDPGFTEGQAFVYVLDAAARQLLPGGGALELTHQIVRIQSKEAASQLGEVRLPPGAELRRLRVIKPDGQIVEPEPAHETGDVSISGLGVGDYLETRYLMERGPDSLDRSSLYRFFFASRVPMFESSFVLAGPVEEIEALQLLAVDAPAPQRELLGSQLRLRFTARAVPALRAEPFSGPSTEDLPHLTVSQGVDAGLYARRAARALARGDARNADLRQFARQATRGIHGARAQLEALVGAVLARVPVEGGERNPITTLTTGSGQRLLLLRAAAQEVGLDLRLVALLRQTQLALVDWAGSGPEDHALLVRIDGAEIPVTLGRHMVRIGGLPPQFRGGKLIEVDPAGSRQALLGKTRTVPEGWTRQPADRMEIEAELAADGTLRGRFTMTLHAPLAGFLRASLRRADLRDAARAVEGWFGTQVPGAALAGFELQGLEDEQVPLQLAARFEARDYAVVQDRSLVVARFLPGLSLLLGGERAAPAGFLRVAQRRTPLYLPPHHEQAVVRLRLPEGSTLQSGPVVIDANGAHGRYRQHSVMSGATLEVRRELARDFTRVAAADYPALREVGERVAARVSTQLVIALPR